METLDQIRQEIDETDKQLTELFIKRMSLADRVAATKISTFAPIFRADRERDILDSVARAMSDELTTKGKSFFSSLMLLSREKQYSAYIMGGAFPKSVLPFSDSTPISTEKICYYGDIGSWCNLAAKEFSKTSEMYGVTKFSDVFHEVSCGNASAGILPVENSTAGSIREVYDLLSQYDLFISGALTLEIKYCLACKENADMSTVKKVYSHVQSLAQCKEYLEKHGFSAEPFKNTAGAAKFVSDSNDITFAALCNSWASKEYSLKVIDSAICDEQSNTTRFIVVTKKPFIDKDADTISIKFSVDHESGTLSHVLDIFRDLGININKLESRPIPNEKFRYSFYLDFCGRLDEHNVLALLLQLESELSELKVLGNYKIKEQTSW
ncbi:MAG: chorismate mutase [Clostridia bacterium]|nr:chorismate mutase [Clostridia bacterium]